MKKIAFVLFSLFLLTSMNIEVSASDTNEEYIKRNQGDEKTQEKNEEALRKKEENFNVSPLGWGDTIRPSMSVYKQEEGYYCGPANVKMVLQSVKGSSYSQSTYASNMLTNKNDGTFVYRMVNELNKYVAPAEYSYKYIDASSRQYLMNSLVTDIVANYPAILHADTFPLIMYNGNSLGHYLTVDTVIADGSNSSVITRVGYLDSYYVDFGKGSVYGRHTDTFDNIFRSVLNRYLIW